MATLFQTSAMRAANHLFNNSGKQINWSLTLTDNRRGKALKEIGIIPYERRGGRAYYNDSDIIEVANVVKLHKLIGQPLPKMFS
ncbi:hypothetical protein H4J59_11080 [Colwellia sp. MB02u-10]|jgi:hypothetical protein|uniref:hypothetical protein n=1 Tax=Colwellia sp. MB02u-10 TaxID=2759828 RepID=UPI0015F50E8A|nr:hypothetical protein [Colwellia sp. MB02u-10]MBA6341529.1 hypothetical protein [Colwellia sp. MB02u-10]